MHLGADKSNEELIEEIDTMNKEFDQVKKDIMQYEISLRKLAESIDCKIEEELKKALQ